MKHFVGLRFSKNMSMKKCVKINTFIIVKPIYWYLPIGINNTDVKDSQNYFKSFILNLLNLIGT